MRKLGACLQILNVDVNFYRAKHTSLLAQGKKENDALRGYDCVLPKKIKIKVVEYAKDKHSSLLAKSGNK